MVRWTRYGYLLHPGVRSLYPNLSVSPRVCCGILRSQVFNFSSGDINATLERFEKAANSNHVQRESKSNKDYRSLAKLGDEESIRPIPDSRKRQVTESLTVDAQAGRAQQLCQTACCLLVVLPEASFVH